MAVGPSGWLPMICAEYGIEPDDMLDYLPGDGLLELAEEFVCILAPDAPPEDEVQAVFESYRQCIERVAGEWQ